MTSTDNVIKLKQPSTVIELTEKSVLRLENSSKPRNVIDKKTGMRVRIGTTKRVYTIYKWFNGKPLKHDIGLVGEITLKEARKIYQSKMSLLAQGIDFRNVMDDGVEYQTIKVLCKTVLDNKSKAGKHSPKTSKLYKDLMNGYISSKILNATFKDLKKKDYVDWYLNGSSVFSSNNANKLISLAFNSMPHAQKLALEHPNEMLRDVKIYTDKIAKKERYINPEPASNELGEFITWGIWSVFGSVAGEVTKQDLIEQGIEVKKSFKPKTIWHSKPHLNYRNQFDCLIFMLLTGIRDEKARELTWEQVNFEEGYIDFNQLKRKEIQRCEFTNQIYWLLMWRWKNKPNKKSKYVFPQNDDWTKSITTTRYVYQFINKHAKLAQKQSAHTLRRTIGNVSNWLGYGKEIESAILHHAPQDVGTINYINRREQHRHALQKCHDYIDARFAEGIIANHVDTPYPFSEDKDSHTSAFGAIYGTRNRMIKDKDFYADVFEPRKRVKNFSGDFID